MMNGMIVKGDTIGLKIDDETYLSYGGETWQTLNASKSMRDDNRMTCRWLNDVRRDVLSCGPEGTISHLRVE